MTSVSSGGQAAYGLAQFSTASITGKATLTYTVTFTAGDIVGSGSVSSGVFGATPDVNLNDNRTSTTVWVQ